MLPSYLRRALLWAWLALFTLALVNMPAALKERGVAYIYTAASRLTDPLASAHELHRQKLLVDTLCPDAAAWRRSAQKGLLFLGSCAHSFFSLFTTLPGIELRTLALFLQDNPYLYYQSKTPGKERSEEKLSMLSWNVCCVSGGYSITQGGVLPWKYRLERLAETICVQDADLVCLYEIFDIQTAQSLICHLESIYSHFYYNIGPCAVGLSSGLFVASKFKMGATHFVPFSSVVSGASQYLKKGFFSFEVIEENGPVARIVTTHLNHSEVPDSPTECELHERKKEMQSILAHIQEVTYQSAQPQVCAVTGDLNLDEKEFLASGFEKCFDRGEIKSAGFTWGGDGFCCSLQGRPISKPVALDHTLLIKNPFASLTVDYVEAGFEGDAFYPEALSDHKGLYSVIRFDTSLQANK